MFGSYFNSRIYVLVWRDEQTRINQPSVGRTRKATAETEADGPSAGGRPQDPERHFVCVEDGVCVGRYATSVRIVCDVLAALAAVDGSWERIWQTLLEQLDGAGKIEWAQALLDGSFVPAKKGAMRAEGGGAATAVG